jgi:hypothetical protein
MSNCFATKNQRPQKLMRKQWTQRAHRIFDSQSKCDFIYDFITYSKNDNWQLPNSPSRIHYELNDKKICFASCNIYTIYIYIYIYIYKHEILGIFYYQITIIFITNDKQLFNVIPMALLIQFIKTIQFQYAAEYLYWPLGALFTIA